MRVLMVTPGFYPIRGGTETIVRELSIGLNRMGIKTDIMTFNQDKKFKPKWKGKTEKIDCLKVFKIPALKLLPSSYRINMGVNLLPGNFSNIMRQYDIIHFHEVEFSFPLFSFLIKKPKILHLHGIDPQFFKRYHISRMLLKYTTDYYIVITNEQKNDLIRLGINKNRVFHLPNSINTQIFHPNNQEKRDNTLLYVGRITPVKGLHVLLRSLRCLKTSVNLVIIGPVDDRKYYGNINNLIEKENRKGRHKIEYLDVRPLEEVIRFYQAATIFILPSYWEASPVVILEALACGTPVITTPVGGIPEIIKDQETGVLIPPGDHICLAKAIQNLLENKNIRLNMGREGRKYVEKNHSIENATKNLCKIYEQISDK